MNQRFAKFLLPILFSFAVTSKVSACMGLELESAQERDATAKFVGTASAYRIHDIKNHALISFKVARTLRGEPRQTWSLFFRSNALPANLTEFQKRFGQIIEVGARESIAPGERSDSKKKAFYIVDAACSMNGEDWLLKKIE